MKWRYANRGSPSLLQTQEAARLPPAILMECGAHEELVLSLWNLDNFSRLMLGTPDEETHCPQVLPLSAKMLNRNAGFVHLHLRAFELNGTVLFSETREILEPGGHHFLCDAL